MKTLFVAILLMFLHTAHAGEQSSPTITVYKSPTCGCCQGWVDYLRDNGYAVEVHDVDSVDDVKTRLGLTDPGLKSCHTAVMDGYVIEGHVPVVDIERLMAERPAILGISAPGMPQMSPGMMSRIPQGYDVIQFDAEGRQSVFSEY